MVEKSTEAGVFYACLTSGKTFLANESGGGSKEMQVEQPERQEDVQAQRQAEIAAGDDGAEDFKALLTRQDARIKELEGQIAEPPRPMRTPKS